MIDIAELAKDYLKKLEKISELKFLASECNKGELAAFIAFSISLPTNFLLLVDTYNVLKYLFSFISILICYLFIRF